MPKTFYTLHDIQDFAKAGVTRVEYNDDIVITDEARERAPHLGMELVRADRPRPPEAVARVETATTYGRASLPAPTGQPATVAPTDIHTRVRSAVVAQLGGQVDPALLDKIIARVLAQVAGGR